MMQYSQADSKCALFSNSYGCHKAAFFSVILKNIIHPLKVLILNILVSNIVLNYLSEERLANLDFFFYSFVKEKCIISL